MWNASEWVAFEVTEWRGDEMCTGEVLSAKSQARFDPASTSTSTNVDSDDAAATATVVATLRRKQRQQLQLQAAASFMNETNATATDGGNETERYSL